MKVTLDKAKEIIRNGGIGIFPTDTAFGIGCRIDNKDAITRLISIKNRPKNQSMPIIFSSIQQVEQYVLPLSQEVKKLMSDFWPGALTIILPANISKVASYIYAENKTIAVRIPDHHIPLNLMINSKIPLIATSANFHGEKTPYDYTDIDERLVEKVDFILEGICTKKNVSTIIDCSQARWEIVRQGAIKVNL